MYGVELGLVKGLSAALRSNYFESGLVLGVRVTLV